jgi:hypothetical protein
VKFGHSSAKYSVSLDIPVYNIQSAWIFQSKYALSMDIPVRIFTQIPVHKYSVSTDIPVKMFSQYGYSSTDIFVSRNITVQNLQLVWIFQYTNVQSAGILQYTILN